MTALSVYIRDSKTGVLLDGTVNADEPLSWQHVGVGVWTTDVAQNTSYQLDCSCSGYTSQSRDVGVGSVPVTVTFYLVAMAQPPPVQPDANVEVYVYQQKTNTPIPNATVVCYGLNIQVEGQTDIDGICLFTVPMTRNVELVSFRVEAADYATTVLAGKYISNTVTQNEIKISMTSNIIDGANGKKSPPPDVYEGGSQHELIDYFKDWRGTDYSKFWEFKTDRDGTANNNRVKWESFFQAEDHVAFSPATSRHGIENAILLGIVLRLSKTPEGQKILERLAIKYLDTCGQIIASIQNASQTNWLTALNNQHITAGIAHRIGLMDDGAYLKVLDHYRSVFDKMFTESVLTSTLGSVGTLVQGSKWATGGAHVTSEGIVSMLGALKGLGK